LFIKIKKGKKTEITYI